MIVVNILFDFIKLIIEAFVSLFWAMLDGAFSISDAFDSAKEQIISAGLHIPLIIVSVAFTIATIIGIIISITRKHH